MTEKNGVNYKAFIPIGVTFLGAGVVFLTAVNSGVGTGLMVVGAIWIVIGAVKVRKK